MRIWLHKIEAIVDGLIPPVLAALVIVIVAELFFSVQFDHYRNYADLFDGFVVVIFAADLGFKYARVRKMRSFVRKYWLEIVATIPFFLVFRLLELLRVPEFIEAGQRLAHEIPVAENVEREAAAIADEIAKTGEVSRTARMLRTFKVFGRMPRFAKSFHFFEKPAWQHRWHEKKHKKP